MSKNMVRRIEGERYIRIPVSVMYNKRLGVSELRIYSYIFTKAYYTEDEWVKISNVELSECLQLTKSTVSRGVARLKTEGIFDIEISRSSQLGICSTVRRIRILIVPK